jgi:hypothetical protein
MVRQPIGAELHTQSSRPSIPATLSLTVPSTMEYVQGPCRKAVMSQPPDAVEQAVILFDLLAFWIGRVLTAQLTQESCLDCEAKR